MIRHGRYKYIHYVGMPAMLYDLAADPEELHDLGADPAHASALRECELALRRVVDPEAVNRLCLEDQARKIEAVGGVEAILKRGMFRYSPPPGDSPVMYS
jgi:choline-sulfatase